MIICTFLFLQGVAGQSIFPFRHFVQHQSGKMFIFHVQRPPSRYKNFGIGSQNCLFWCPRWWQFHRKHCKVVYAQGKASHQTKWQRRQPRKLVYSQENFQLRRRSQKGVRNVTNKTCSWYAVKLCHLLITGFHTPVDKKLIKTQACSKARKMAGFSKFVVKDFDLTCWLQWHCKYGIDSRLGLKYIRYV